LILYKVREIFKYAVRFGVVVQHKPGAG
jgi:hypothetical protein